MPLLDIKNLSVDFKTASGFFRAVDNVSMTVDTREVLAIVGESGSGKSVSMLAVMGLLPWTAKVTADKIDFDGRDLLNITPADRRKITGKDMAMIFQEPMSSLNPCFTVGFQLMEAMDTHLDLTRAQQKARAIELLEEVGIPAPETRLGSYPHQLSGGMSQRVMIAMALSCNPKFLIADEPTTALDVTIQAQILELIQTLQEKFHMTVQFITHDLGVISEISDRVLVMYGGQPCEIAPTQELFSNPKHPYTAALIGSRPKVGHRVSRLQTIEGSVPAPHELPLGCAFQNRCSRVKDECRFSRPPMKNISAVHQVACFNPVN
jgi:peptide/nickel transport system ATP-binding protein